MNILIAYATTEGQNRKIAEFVAKHIRGQNNRTVLFDTSSMLQDVDVDDFGKVIVAASVHQRKHQECMEIFVTAKQKKLEAKPSMFFSVSLAAAFNDTMKEARRYTNDFTEALNWQPTKTLCVAGAVRHEEYGFYREQILEHVVLDGTHLDDFTEDQEFTDWHALANAVDEFLSA